MDMETMSALTLILISAVVEISGALKPVVSFTPKWATILEEDSLTLTCNVDSAEQGDHRYSWYKDDKMINRVQQIFVIKSAQQEDTGDYQCETSSGDRSDAVRLTVSSDDVILQVPPDLHEGDSLSVRCHSKAGLLQRHLTFFKDGNSITPLDPDSHTLIRIADMNATGEYTCSKQLYFSSSTSYRPYTAVEVFISVKELFSYPQVKVSPDLVTEGANMTVTCVTTLSPLRASTELRFTFYMNQHIVQESSPSNKYQVHSAQMEDSGNYSCDVRTSNNIIKKSKVTQIHIVESNRGVVVQNIVRLVLSACISLMTICLLFYHMKTQRTSKPQVKEGEVSACP